MRRFGFLVLAVVAALSLAACQTDGVTPATSGASSAQASQWDANPAGWCTSNAGSKQGYCIRAAQTDHEQCRAKSNYEFCRRFMLQTSGAAPSN